MPSLDETYDRKRRWADVRDPRRVGTGLALVGSGVLAVALAVVVLAVGGDTTAAKQFAGIVAGTGIPVLLLGIVVVLPASSQKRRRVFVGTAFAGLGVVLFWFAYPDRWTQTADSLAFETLAVYTLGCAVALWFVFGALVSTRLRNNPQGTVSLEVVREGETKTVEVSHDRYRELVGDGGDAREVIEELERES
jgi:hypothetical protein